MVARKLTLILFAVVFLTAIVLGALWTVEVVRNIERAKIVRLNTLARASRVAVENMLNTGSLQDLQTMVSRLEESREIVGVLIVNTAGDLIIAPSFEPSPELLRRIAATETPATFEARGGRWVIRSLPLAGRLEPRIGTLAVVQTWADVFINQQRAIVRALVSAVLLATVVGLTLFAAVRFVVATPLAELMRAVDAVARGRMGPGSRVQLPQADEIGRLGRALNHMQDELESARAQFLVEHEGKLQLERSLQTSERLAAVGQLAAGVAHDIGTALNVVRGRAQLLLESKSATGQTRRSLEIVVGQCDRISETVRRLLDFARPREAVMQRVDVNAIVHESLELLAPELRGVEVRLQLAAKPVAVRADRSHIQQLFVNLAMNALQSMNSDRRLGVETRVEARPPSGETGRFALLRIADSGSGIASENVRRIFEPFYTTKSDQAGTGLGLAISYQIVADHDGEIAVESEPGKGTEISVYLPIYEPTERND